MVVPGLAVEQAGIHDRAEFGANGPAVVVADIAPHVASPVVLGVERVEEGILVVAEEATIQAAIGSDRGGLMGVAAAVEDQPVPRDAGKGGQPVGVEVVQGGGPEAVGFVDRFEEDGFVSTVPGHHGRPHALERGRIGRLAMLYGPVADDDPAPGQGRVDGAGIGIPASRDGRFVDRHSNGVGACERIHLADDSIRDLRRAGVCVRVAEPGKDQNSGLEVVARVSPVLSFEQTIGSRWFGRSRHSKPPCGRRLRTTE